MEHVNARQIGSESLLFKKTKNKTQHFIAVNESNSACETAYF